MGEITEGYVRAGGSWRRFWPEREPETTSIFNASSSKSWRDNWGWRNDVREEHSGPNDRVYQGEWSDPPPYGNHRGLWFYDISEIQNTLRADGGRRITSITITMKRREINGYWHPVDIYAWLHNHAAPPKGKPSLGKGPHRLGKIDRGEEATFALPTSWGNALRDGSARGIGLFRAERGPYAIMEGVTVHAASGRLTVVHS